MSFSQALSGLNAASSQLDVIGNNIANSQGVGFKGSRVLFSDIYAGAEAGLGARIAAVQQNFQNGALEGTGRNLDLAISGNGFFRFEQGGQAVYSRNGQLSINSNGYLENAQGARLTGYPDGVGTGGDPQQLRVPAGAMPAQATSSLEAALNLDTGAPISAQPFDPSNSNSYAYANNVTVVDAQGTSHNLTLYFSKTAPNNWDVHLGIGGEVAAETGQLVFDDSGQLESAQNLDSFVFNPADQGGPLAEGVAPLDMSLTLDETTQFGSAFELSSASQNGFESGSLVSVSFDTEGNLIGNYSNQQTQVLGTVVLASFINEEGLEPLGDNIWGETTESGSPLLGLASTGQFGSVEPSAVETSNVDLAQELVNLIIAQRNYQANSQTIKVRDEVLQNAVNLR